MWNEFLEGDFIYRDLVMYTQCFPQHLYAKCNHTAHREELDTGYWNVILMFQSFIFPFLRFGQTLKIKTANLLFWKISSYLKVEKAVWQTTMSALPSFSNYQLISPSFDLADVQTFNSGLPRCCLESGWSMTEVEIGFARALAKRGLNHLLSIIRALAPPPFFYWFGIVLLILFSIAFSMKVWMKNA